VLLVIVNTSPPLKTRCQKKEQTRAGGENFKVVPEKLQSGCVTVRPKYFQPLLV